MGGMFGDLKKLSTHNPQPVSSPAKATPPPAKNISEAPLQAPVPPPETITDHITTTTTPLPGNATQTIRDKRTTDVAGLPANQQTSKPVRQQTSLPTNPQASKPVNQQDSKPANPQASKPTKKFTSYLTEESIRALKRLALDEDKKDYEVLQEAVDAYLLKNGSSSE